MRSMRELKLVHCLDTAHTGTTTTTTVTTTTTTTTATTTTTTTSHYSNYCYHDFGLDGDCRCKQTVRVRPMNGIAKNLATIFLFWV